MMQLKANVSAQRAVKHQRFIDALGPAVESHSDIYQRPLEIELNKPFSMNIRVYLFTCSNPPGGRAPNEYKFNLNVPGQVERGSFDTSGNYLIILCAYVDNDNPNLRIFILCDASMHNNFALNANIQTKVELIQNARIQGIATLNKKNGECLIAANKAHLLEAIKLRNDLTFKKLFSE